MPAFRVTSGWTLDTGELRSSVCLSTDSLGNCQEQKRKTQGCSHLFVKAKTVLANIFYLHPWSLQPVPHPPRMLYIITLSQSIQIKSCFTRSARVGSWAIMDMTCFLEILTQNSNTVIRTYWSKQKEIHSNTTYHFLTLLRKWYQRFSIAASNLKQHFVIMLAYLLLILMNLVFF